MHVAVTGASSGIGEALVREYVKRGASVSAVARRLDLLEKLAAGSGGKVQPFKADLSDVEHCCDWLAEAEAALGPVDVLINNAGVTMVTHTDTAEWARGEALLRLNVHTPFKLTQAVLPGMLRRDSGCIVNIASVAGLAPMPGAFFYNASKGALAAASEGLRGELRKTGVRVLTVYPGPVHTAMEKEALAGFEKIPAYTPTGTPERLAVLVADAVARGSARVIYPRFYTLARWFPPLARWVSDRLTPPLRAR